MRTTPLIVAAIVALLAPLPLNAGVIEHDFLTPGDGLLTYDDVNQREWLDLTFTAGINLSAIKAAILPGGHFENFSFATLEDVKELALSAEVQWQSPAAIANPLAISPNLIPTHTAPALTVIPPDSASASKAKDLFNLLGNVFTYEITETFIARSFFNSTPLSSSSDSLISITDSFHFSFGQIAQENVVGEAHFNETSATVFFLESSSLIRGHFESYVTNGGITTGPPAGLDGAPLPAGDQGPFWLYRTAVPEPSSTVLLTIAALALLSRRTRDH